jgi:hypothetical protein
VFDKAIAGCRADEVAEIDPSATPAKLCEMVFVASTGEDFHRHGVADGDLVSDQAIDCVARRRIRVAKNLDRRRGVDEDHALLARISSPSHPTPLRAVSAPRRRRGLAGRPVQREIACSVCHAALAAGDGSVGIAFMRRATLKMGDWFDVNPRNCSVDR